MPSRVVVIAEAGVNHNGSRMRAFELVDVAADAGADAVKFQTFKADKLVTRAAPKAAYQLQTTSAAESQHEMIRKLELSDEDHAALAEHCVKRGIEFLSTPFDIESLTLLTGRLGVARLKLSSGDITNGPLLLACARSHKPAIVSTGMSTLADIEAALGVLAFGYTNAGEPSSSTEFDTAYASAAGQAALREKVTLLHCTTEYPAPLPDVHLRAMETLAQAFGLAVGYSDHTEGIAIPIAAVARGATMIEKHITTDRGLPGPDHKASLEPGELKAMVRAIREVEAALGSARKQPAASELKNRPIARKSLVATRAIRKGEPFTRDNLGTKRPGDGVSAIHYWDWLGRTAPRDYGEDEKVDP